MKFIKSFSIIMLITLFTQILLMIRSMILAKEFGVSPEMDAFNIANVITVSSMSIISAAITTVLIPLLSKSENTKEEIGSVNTYITIIFTITLGLLLLIYFLGPPIINNFFPNSSDQIKILTFQLTMILAVSQLFKVFTGLSTAFLQVNSDFINPKIATFLSASTVIIYFLFDNKPSIVAITIIIGISFIIEYMYIFLIQKKLRTKYRISFQIKNPKFKLLLANTIPIIMSSAAFQFSIVFSNFMASYFGEGYISIFSYSNQVVNIFHSLMILNIMMILYPNLANKFELNIQDAKESLVNYMIVTNALVIPIVFGFLAVGNMIIELLFQRGNFTAQNTELVFQMAAILFLSFPINTIRDFVYRSFYSIKDTKTPSRNSIFIVFVNMFLILILLPIFKFYAISIGPVVASVISLILSFNKLEKKIGVIDKEKKILKSNIGFTVSGLIMYLILIITKNFLAQTQIGLLKELLLLILIGAFIYLIIIFLTQKKLIKNIIKDLI